MTPSDDGPEGIEQAVRQACASFDITIRGGPSAVETTSTGAETYKATVPIEGQVLLEDVLDDQGPLMYLNDGIEVQWKGVTDDGLLLAVDVQD